VVSGFFPGERPLTVEDAVGIHGQITLHWANAARIVSNT
jgi:hypothetical protein